MNLQELFLVFPGVQKNSYSEIEVTSICNDSRKVVPRSVFVAIRGHYVDGHDYINKAVENGAMALVVEDKEKVSADFEGLVFIVPDSRQVLDILSVRFFGYPGNELFCVGVTGTNGKTSVTYMVESILNRNLLLTGVIGTIDHHIGSHHYSSTLTTPDSIELQSRLKDFLQEGARAVAMEVSSHALVQGRVESVPFNSVVFTNLTHDHLDFHGTMKDYFAAKQKLFNDLLWKSNKKNLWAIVNVDDPWGRQIIVADRAIIWTYGQKDADFEFKILNMDFSGTYFELATPFGEISIHLPLLGLHNVYNAVASIAVGLSAGVKLELCKKAIEEFPGVPGRLEVVSHFEYKNVKVFIDYAHTPDALKNVLSSLCEVRNQSLTQNHRIGLVFGCGGDRDRTKRPEMARVAAQFADYIYVTSDNPRTEDSHQIIQDIVKGFSAEDQLKFKVEIDRRLAIQYAIQESQEGDVILIAGKGHEKYQIIQKQSFPFDDYQVAKEFLNGGGS